METIPFKRVKKTDLSETPLGKAYSEIKDVACDIPSTLTLNNAYASQTGSDAVKNCIPPVPAIDWVTSGSLIYLLAKDLLIYDISNPAKPTLIGKTPISFGDGDEGYREEEAKLKKLGAAIYVIAEERGHSSRSSCKVFDVSNPAKPIERSQINADPPEESDELNPAPVAISSPVASPPTSDWYLCLPSSLSATHGGWISIFIPKMTIFDLSDPFKPTPVFSTTALHHAPSAAIFKDTLYVADDEGGLVIFKPSLKN